jgi:hypothetical protein
MDEVGRLLPHPQFWRCALAARFTAMNDLPATEGSA